MIDATRYSFVSAGSPPPEAVGPDEDEAEADAGGKTGTGEAEISDEDADGEGEAVTEGISARSGATENASAAPQTPPRSTMSHMTAIALHETFRPVLMLGHRNPRAQPRYVRPPAGASS